MLKGISKHLTGDLLKALCDMGHGDMVAIVDANFPAHTMGKRVLNAAGISATDLLKDILSVFPLDHIVEMPAILMEMTPEDRRTMPEPEIWEEFASVIQSQYGQGKKVGKVSREAFYERSKEAYLIVQSGEERLYGNIILVKGVIK